MEDLRYPIGKFQTKSSYTEEEINSFIQRIDVLPAAMQNAVKGLSNDQLSTPYREGGWTVRQVVHHVADSHMNAFIRVKWALTENTPMIKAYDEVTWALTPEVSAPPEISIELLTALHRKWVVLWRGLKSTDFSREFIHPDSKKNIRIDTLCGMYAWHGDHHLAHITSLKKRMNWL